MMKKYLIMAMFFLSIAPVFSVIAQVRDENSPDIEDQNINIGITNPFRCGQDCTIESFFAAIVERVLLPIGGIVAVIAFIWSGFKFVTAQGDSKKLEEAKTALWYTAIGTAILLGAVAIANVIKNTIEALR